ncbi:MAG: hypothetical protein ACOYYS_20350 [Chloroflexota bacterium]
MKDDLQKAQQRTLQYWMVDGLSEISLGVLNLSLGVYFYLQATLAAGSLLYTILNACFVWLIVIGAFAMRSAVGALKTRLTYPRTGFVAYRREAGANRWLRAAIAFGIAILTSLLFSSLVAENPVALDWMPAAMGAVFSLALLVMAWRTALLRVYLLSAGALVCGAALSWAGIGNTLGVAYFYLITSAMLAVSGGYTLFRYLRSAPALEGETEAVDGE